LKAFSRCGGKQRLAVGIADGAPLPAIAVGRLPAMIKLACDRERAFDLILVHSYSWLFAMRRTEVLSSKDGEHPHSIRSRLDETNPCTHNDARGYCLFDQYQSKNASDPVMKLEV
jgi:hypothetical protein